MSATSCHWVLNQQEAWGITTMITTMDLEQRQGLRINSLIFILVLLDYITHSAICPFKPSLMTVATAISHTVPMSIHSSLYTPVFLQSHHPFCLKYCNPLVLSLHRDLRFAFTPSTTAIFVIMLSPIFSK